MQLAFLNLGAPEVILTLLLLLLFFGAEKIPQLARSLGRAKAEMDKARRSVTESFKTEEDKAWDEQVAFERERERKMAEIAATERAEADAQRKD